MPTKERDYIRAIFPPEIIKAAEQKIAQFKVKAEVPLLWHEYRIKLSPIERWTYDNESEFFADYRKGFETAYFAFNDNGINLRIWVYNESKIENIHTDVSVYVKTREQIESVYAIFDENCEKHCIPIPPKKELSLSDIKIFIGHGQNNIWRDLKDHLHEKHGMAVEAYELGARAGLTIKEVLDEMLRSSSFALIVFTGEDLDALGNYHPRENVIHELGLFQGKLGWRKAVILLEDSVQEFSNIHGINQIRFHADRIQETYGEVLATIKREFVLI
jgi:predicted nucleotide-binding protein